MESEDLFDFSPLNEQWACWGSAEVGHIATFSTAQGFWRFHDSELLLPTSTQAVPYAMHIFKAEVLHEMHPSRSSGADPSHSQHVTLAELAAELGESAADGPAAAAADGGRADAACGGDVASAAAGDGATVPPSEADGDANATPPSTLALRRGLIASLFHELLLALIGAMEPCHPALKGASLTFASAGNGQPPAAGRLSLWCAPAGAEGAHLLLESLVHHVLHTAPSDGASKGAGKDAGAYRAASAHRPSSLEAGPLKKDRRARSGSVDASNGTATATSVGTSPTLPPPAPPAPPTATGGGSRARAQLRVTLRTAARLAVPAAARAAHALEYDPDIRLPERALPPLPSLGISAAPWEQFTPAIALAQAQLGTRRGTGPAVLRLPPTGAMGGAGGQVGGARPFGSVFAGQNGGQQQQQQQLAAHAQAQAHAQVQAAQAALARMGASGTTGRRPPTGRTASTSTSASTSTASSGAQAHTATSTSSTSCGTEPSAGRAGRVREREREREEGQGAQRERTHSATETHTTGTGTGGGGGSAAGSERHDASTGPRGHAVGTHAMRSSVDASTGASAAVLRADAGTMTLLEPSATSASSGTTTEDAPWGGDVRDKRDSSSQSQVGRDKCDSSSQSHLLEVSQVGQRDSCVGPSHSSVHSSHSSTGVDAASSLPFSAASSGTRTVGVGAAGVGTSVDASTLLLGKQQQQQQVTSITYL
ncbi:hypothetical protein T492DRAFT_849387 [Pavlovales sp. CCMP2436]|nr:hypothetical protein T492DRAFT_849387 [Pavlovales sp. CCMP2436]